MNGVSKSTYPSLCARCYMGTHGCMTRRMTDRVKMSWGKEGGPYLYINGCVCSHPTVLSSVNPIVANFMTRNASRLRVVVSSKHRCQVDAGLKLECVSVRILGGRLSSNLCSC